MVMSSGKDWLMLSPFWWGSSPPAPAAYQSGRGYPYPVGAGWELVGVQSPKKQSHSWVALALAVKKGGGEGEPLWVMFRRWLSRSILPYWVGHASSTRSPPTGTAPNWRVAVSVSPAVSATMSWMV